MTIHDVMKDMTTGVFKNLYIFYGVELAVMNLYIDKISSKFNKVFTDCTIDSVYKKLYGNSLFQSCKELYVIRNDSDFINAEKMWDNIENLLKKHDIFVILKYDSIDQRSKFYKRFADSEIQFDYMNKEILIKHIKKSIDIPDSYCEYLIDICNSDYSRILLEIDKVKNLKKDSDMSDAACFKKCYDEHVFYEPPEDVVFNLIDSILSRDRRLSYSLLNESKRRSDNPIMILSLLHNNVKQLLQVQEIGNVKNKADSTGLTPFQIKTVSKYIGKRTSKELTNIIKLIKYCDKSIKDGTLSQDIVLDYLLVGIL